jgi:hypothetical protein
MTFDPTITVRCCTWRLTLADGETAIRTYDVPQCAAVALASRPGVTAAEPVGEVFEPKPRRRRTPRAAAIAEPVTTPTRGARPAALEIPDETPRWQWPELLTQITRAHFEGRR